MSFPYSVCLAAVLLLKFVAVPKNIIVIMFIVTFNASAAWCFFNHNSFSWDISIGAFGCTGFDTLLGVRGLPAVPLPFCICGHRPVVYFVEVCYI